MMKKARLGVRGEGGGVGGSLNFLCLKGGVAEGVGRGEGHSGFR